MMWYMGNGWGWWMIFGWVWMVIIWGLIIWAVFAVTGHLRRNDGGRSVVEPTALEILERRYARGELTHDEFEQMRNRLLASKVRTP